MVGGFKRWLAGWTTGSTFGRDREGGGLDGGNQQGKRETDAGAVRRSRKESGFGKEVSKGVKGKKGKEKRRQTAKPPDCTVHCTGGWKDWGVQQEVGRKWWPPQLALSHRFAPLAPIQPRLQPHSDAFFSPKRARLYSWPY